MCPALKYTSVEMPYTISVERQQLIFSKTAFIRPLLRVFFSCHFSPPISSVIFTPAERSSSVIWQSSSLPINSLQSPYNPLQFPDNLLQFPYNPVQFPYNPLQFPYNPLQFPYNPLQFPRNPLQFPYNSLQFPYNPLQFPDIAGFSPSILLPSA